MDIRSCPIVYPLSVPFTTPQKGATLSCGHLSNEAGLCHPLCDLQNKDGVCVNLETSPPNPLSTSWGAEGATVEKKGFIGHTFNRQTRKRCQMNLRKLYQWVKVNSKDWIGVSRHFRANVQVFSRAVVLSQSSQVRKL